MAGLLDGFSEFVKTPEGQGLLAATFGGLAGARSGAPINSLGRAGLAGLQGYGGALDRQQQMAEAEQTKKLRDMQMEAYQAQAEQAKQEREANARISAGMAQFFKPGQSALAPLVGDPSIGILPSSGRAAVAPSFDAAGAAQFLATNGKYEDALKYMPKPKELQVNKLDPKDYTPESVQKFAESGKYSDLVRMDKAQFQNTGGFTMALDPFTGKPLNQIQNTQSPDSKASTAVSWANYGLSKDRLNMDKQKFALETSGAGAGPKMTEDQAKATGWLVQADQAHRNMLSVMKANPDAAKPGFNDALSAIPSFGFTGGLANMMRTEDRQKFMQASSSLSEALLRAATGAGVNQDEANQKVRELTPQIGDSDAVIKQKAAAIPLYIESLRVRAGPGAAKAQSIMSNSSTKLPGMNLPSTFGQDNSDPLGLFKR